MVTSIIQRLSNAFIVPVVRLDDVDLARRASHILVQTGIRALEITMTVPGAPALLPELRKAYPDVVIGAGTVLSAEDCRAVIGGGVDFLVSPCWRDGVAEVAEKAGIPYLPGAMTPGEIIHHAEAGAAAVKMFPADAAGGPSFLKGVKAVFPTIPIMPTGGITPDQVSAYRAAGAFCVGLGGNLIPAAALKAGDEDGARRSVQDALAQMRFT